MFLLANSEDPDLMLHSRAPTPIAQLVECPLRGREVTGSIPGRDIPKSLKMVLTAPRLGLRFMG